ncbi:MAG TPA: helix-turn-helix transcriptional regulator [Deinococcales bacterium]|nr:helix-turn-helix transcriptional regulator [Deinococcales bacterium]
MGDEFKDPRLRALAGRPEREAQVGAIPEGLLDDAGSFGDFKARVEEALAPVLAGQLLRRAREARGLSVREAARRLGRSPSRVTAIEHARALNVATLVEAARALGYAVDVRLVPLDATGDPLAARLGLESPAIDPPPAAPKALMLPSRKGRR